MVAQLLFFGKAQYIVCNPQHPAKANATYGVSMDLRGRQQVSFRPKASVMFNRITIPAARLGCDFSDSVNESDYREYAWTPLPSSKTCAASMSSDCHPS